MTAPRPATSRADEWRKRLLSCVTGLLVFETLTGLGFYLLPFSVPGQWMVVFHTIAGLVFVVPFAPQREPAPAVMGGSSARH